jgi:hypothetical protein
MIAALAIRRAWTTTSGDVEAIVFFTLTAIITIIAIQTVRRAWATISISGNAIEICTLGAGQHIT